jgi:hypothetical protein
MTFSDRVTRSLNEQSAEEMKRAFGYAPDPHCKVCGGGGRVHPLGLDGKPDYSKSEMCRGIGCLYESYNRIRV